MRKLTASAMMLGLILVTTFVVIPLGSPFPISSSAASQPWQFLPSLLGTGSAVAEQPTHGLPTLERVSSQANIALAHDAIPPGATDAEPTALSCTSLSNWQCVETRPGLSLCRANNICVVKVDLNNATIRPQVVIAPGGGTAWLNSMASSAGAYAAINGDYFSGCPDTVPPLNCGEGLTFIDHTDYTDYQQNDWEPRRSMGFNDSYDPNIGFHYDQGGYHRQLLGAGPQVSFAGEYQWRCWYQGYDTPGNCACQSGKMVINGEIFNCNADTDWWERQQTFVGFSDDRNTLYLAKSEPGSTNDKTPREMHDVLWVMGARYSLKMDGGGSSGMYFNDGGYLFEWNGSRAVANAWVIVPYSEPPPTCDPNADQIALYADTGNGGSCVTLGVGDYSSPGQLGDLGNDNAESIRVGANVQAVLCEHDNYDGRCEPFLGDDSNLGDNHIGSNSVSSVRVQARGSGWRAEYYSDNNLGAKCYDTSFGDTYVFGDWQAEAPAGGCPTDYFSGRFSRVVHFPGGSYTFGLGYDDGARIEIDGQTVVDGWASAQHYVTQSLSGYHYVVVEYYENTGDAYLSAFWWGPGYDLPRESQDPAQWYAQYWGNRALWWDPVVKVNEGQGTLDHSWGSGGPGYNLPSDRFSSRFERTVSFTCGRWRFTITTDDGVRFWVDDYLQLDAWVDQVEVFSPEEDLTEGDHELRLEHYENSGSATLQMSWELVEPCALPAPALSSPQIGDPMQPGDVTFQWEAVDGATGYLIQIDTVDTLDSPDLISSSVTGTEYTTALSLGRWYWRVQALPEGKFSSVWWLVAAEPVVPVTEFNDDRDPAVLHAADGTLWTVFRSGRAGGLPALWRRTSTDLGTSWSEPVQVTETGMGDYAPALWQTTDGTLWLVWHSSRSGNPDIWYQTSSDGGASWSAAAQLTTDPGADTYPAITQANDGAIWLAWQSDRTGNADIFYTRSSDGGTSWTASTQLTVSGSADSNPTLAQTADGALWIAWDRSNQILYQKTLDGGSSWSGEAVLTGACCYRPQLAVAGDGALWSVSEVFGELVYQWSTDHGLSWTTSRPFTKYAGEDVYPSLALLSDGHAVIAWQSDRWQQWWANVWLGIVGLREDVDPPPFVGWIGQEPDIPESTDVMTLSITALDESPGLDVELVWSRNGVSQANLPMYDDGEHGDSGAGDGRWGMQFGPFAAGTTVEYQMQATDVDGNTVLHPTGPYDFYVVAPFVQTADILLVPDRDGYSTEWYRSFFTSTLDSLNVDYDLWDTGRRGAPDSETLMLYSDGIVIWSMPSAGYFDNADVRPRIEAYLDAGGKLFVTGKDVGEYAGSTSLYQEYLHASFVQGSVDIHTLHGMPNDPIGHGLALAISGGDGANNQWYPDEVDPLSPAVTSFIFEGAAGAAVPPAGDAGRTPVAERIGPAPTPTPPPAPSGMAQESPGYEVDPGSAAEPQDIISSGSGALRVDTGTYRTVYFSFGFEGIDNAGDRAIVMDRVLAWLRGVLARPLQISPEDGSEVPDGEIAFVWHPVVGATGYQIQFDTAETFDSPDLISEIAGSTTYASTLGQGTWYWRVRALPDGEFTPVWRVELQPAVPPSAVAITGPMNGLVGVSHVFTATVDPINTTLPITFVWQASEQDPVTHTVGLSDTVAFNWASAGDKLVSVEASNAGGSASDTHVIAIEESPPPYGGLSFSVDLQGRADDSGVWCATSPDGQSVVQGCFTASDGTCSVMVPPGFYSGEYVMSPYLDSIWCTVEVRSGEMTNVTPVELRGGDVNDDCVTNIQDLAFMGYRFNVCVGDPFYDARGDINADGCINIQDLAIAGGNFGRRCPDICVQTDAVLR